MVRCAALPDTEPVAGGWAPGNSLLTALAFSAALAQLPEPPLPVWLEFVWRWLTPTLGQLRSISAICPNVPAASSCVSFHFRRSFTIIVVSLHDESCPQR